MHFTDSKIRLIKPKEKAFELFDDGRTGLGIRVHPSGQKAFTFTLRRNGKITKTTLGKFGLPEEGKMNLEMARAEVAQLRIEADQGLDPIARRRNNTRLEPFYDALGINEKSTLAETAAAYLKLDAAHSQKDGGKNQSYMLNKHLLPALGNVQMRHIKRADLRAILDDIRYKQDKLYQSNRVRALLSSLFNFAIRYEIVEYNPVTNIKPFKEKSRDVYFETDAEIRLFWTNLDKTTLSMKMRLALRLCLVTGQRISQVLGMTQDELDLEQNEWTIAKDRMKSKSSHTVPLTDLAIGLIKEAIQYSANSHLVFESDNKPGTPIDHTSINRPLTNNLNVFGIPKVWRPHDLRRTFYTHLIKLDISPEIIAHLVDHTSDQGSQLSKIYNQHQYRDKKRQAMEIWCKHLQDVINGPENKAPTNGNVVDFTSHRNKPK